MSIGHIRYVKMYVYIYIYIYICGYKITSILSKPQIFDDMTKASLPKLLFEFFYNLKYLNLKN